MIAEQPQLTTKQSILYKLTENWTKDDLQHLHFLQLNYPLYLGALQDIYHVSNVNPKPNVFRIYKTGTTRCLEKQQLYFHCYDCSLMKDTGLCSKCFDFNEHFNHNWVYMKINGKPQCDCGYTHKLKQPKICKHHKLSQQQIKQNIPLNQQEIMLFKSYFTIFMKITILKFDNKVIKTQYTSNLIMVELIKLNIRNVDYNRLSCQILNCFYSDRAQKTVLQRLLQIGFISHSFKNQVLQLVTLLGNYDKFEYLFAQALFKQLKIYDSNSYSYNEPKNLKFLLLLISNFQILNNLGSKGILAYNPNQKLRLLKYYTQLLQNKQQTSNLHLIQVWKYIYNNKIDILQYYIRYLCDYSQNYFFIILKDSAIDFKFFQQLISLYIKNWQQNQKQKFKSTSSIYNQFVKIALYSVKGNIDDFYTIFQTCDKQKLCKFIRGYLSEILNFDHAKCRFNSLTIKCLLKLIKAYNLNCINQIYIPAQSSPAKFSRILAIVIRNLTAFNNLGYMDIYTIAKDTGNIQLANQKQDQILQWFKQVFFMSGVVHKILMNYYVTQGITKLPKIKDFIMNQVIVKKGNNNQFQYVGKQAYTNVHILLWNLLTGNEVPGIHSDDSKDLYYNKDNSQILQYLFDKPIERINLNNYGSCHKQFRYLLCITAVLLHKITGQQYKKFGQHVDKLKQRSKEFRKSHRQVERLFRIRNYAIKQLRTQQKIQAKKQENQINNQEIIIHNEDNIQFKEQQKISQNLSPKIEQKQQQIQVPIKIQKTPSITKRHQKKQQKMKKFSQRIANRSQKFLSSTQLLQQNQQQTCLVCKQIFNDYSILYHYASLKKNKSNLLYKLYQNKPNLDISFNLTSCFHTVHETCVQKYNRKCILCSLGYDILIPANCKSFDKSTKQIFLFMWWQDQFKKQISKKTNNIKLTNQQYFMILFKSLITNLGFKSLTTTKIVKKVNSRNLGLLELINQIYQMYDQKQKAVFTLEINKYIQQNSVQNAKFMNKIDRILATIILQKLLNNLQNPKIQIQKWVYSKLQQLNNSLQFKYCQLIVKNIEFFIGTQFSQFYQLFLNKPEIIQLWRNLQILKQVPENLRVLRQNRQLCSSCFAFCTYLCITCNKVLCSVCVNVTHHIRHEGCICLNFDGQISYEKDNSIVKTQLYFNFLNSKCDDNCDEWSDYKLNKEILYDTLSKVTCL